MYTVRELVGLWLWQPTDLIMGTVAVCAFRKVTLGTVSGPVPAANDMVQQCVYEGSFDEAGLGLSSRVAFSNGPAVTVCKSNSSTK